MLSPWEFLMHWECCKLPRPKSGADSEDDGLSVWLEPADPDEPNDKNRKFRPNPEAECCTVLFYPIMGDEERDFQLRNKWYMQKRTRPMTPAPNNAPMPDRQPTRQDKARVYSVYLRPWVLDRKHATSEVPHVVDLDQLVVCLGDDHACAGDKPQKRRISMGTKTGPLATD